MRLPTFRFVGRGEVALFQYKVSESPTWVTVPVVLLGVHAKTAMHPNRRVSSEVAHRSGGLVCARKDGRPRVGSELYVCIYIYIDILTYLCLNL